MKMLYSICGIAGVPVCLTDRMCDVSVFIKCDNKCMPLKCYLLFCSTLHFYIFEGKRERERERERGKKLKVKKECEKERERQREREREREREKQTHRYTEMK